MFFRYFSLGHMARPGVKGLTHNLCLDFALFVITTNEGFDFFMFKERGMEDREQVPYYPYRDDGRIIDEMLDDFTKRLIRL